MASAAGFDCESALSSSQNVPEANVSRRRALLPLCLFGASVVMGYCAVGPLVQKAMAASDHGHVLGKGFSANMIPSAKAAQANLGHGGPVMKADERMNRRDILNTAAVATGLATLASNAQPASAKAGQFGKIGIFGMEDLSSPYQPGGPKSGKDATFGYQKSEGPILATGYETDVTREKADFDVSEKIFRAQGANIDKKIWWLARDNFRGQANTMKANMKAINYVSKDPKASDAAQDKFWTLIDAADQACVKKNLPKAQGEYAKAMGALDTWKSVALSS